VYRSQLHDAMIYARTEMVSSSWSLAKLADAWDNRAIRIKAISFALIGLVNTIIDYSVFLSAQAALEQRRCLRSSLREVLVATP
jgi:hypothetical protein